MKNFTVFDKTTGEIKRSGNCGEVVFEAQAIYEEELVLEGIGRDNTHYVDIIDPGTPVITEKKRMDLTIHKTVIQAGGADSFNVMGIPVGAAAVLDGSEYVVDDRELEITVKQPGKYLLKLRHIKYLEEEISFEAV